VLIQGLPLDSWTQTALRDDPNREQLPERSAGDQKFGPWSLINFQLAALTDAVNLVAYYVHASNAKDPKAVKPPEPTARPGMKQQVRQMVDAAEAEAARRYLDEFNRGKG
jgi:hypothetical protein